MKINGSNLESEGIKQIGVNQEPWSTMEQKGRQNVDMSNIQPVLPFVTGTGAVKTHPTQVTAQC